MRTAVPARPIRPLSTSAWRPPEDSVQEPHAYYRFLANALAAHLRDWRGTSCPGSTLTREVNTIAEQQRATTEVLKLGEFGSDRRPCARCRREFIVEHGRNYCVSFSQRLP